MDDNQSFHVPLNHEADQEQPHLPALQPHEVQANELEDQPLHHHLYLEKTGKDKMREKNTATIKKIKDYRTWRRQANHKMDIESYQVLEQLVFVI